jgi:hypothetical protein
MDDSAAPRFGLPPCLWVPIAAVSVAAVERFVGRIVAQRMSRDGRVNAILVQTTTKRAQENLRVKLWCEPIGPLYRERLFPARQVWVHIDYVGYRGAYLKFEMPAIQQGYFLDHIQNRQAVRLREYSHPYVRLCPVSRVVNTSGGHQTGGEGMEKAFLRSRAKQSAGAQDEFRALLQFPIQYADPMDLTKMLDVAPGTETLPGVRDLQSLFYPEREDV